MFVDFNQTTANVGDTVSITVTAINNGFFDWSPVKVYVPLPDGLQFMSFVVPDKTLQEYDPTTGIWDLNTLNHDERGHQKSLIITAKVLPEAAGKELVATAKFDKLVMEGSNVHMENETPPAKSSILKVSPLANATCSGSGNGTCIGSGNCTCIYNPITVNANIKSGTYKTPQTVTLTTNNSTATIYYTTDGSTPTTNSTKYTGAISVITSKTLKFFALDTEGNTSPIYTQQYNIYKLVSYKYNVQVKWKKVRGKWKYHWVKIWKYKTITKTGTKWLKT
ncbi:chitobiase/beta-hexosaminidase C-terminal domain-containing protein [Methanobacterium aggregans]|uniref:chitobiase/beta-hexosaminidase C-terminal domain-containing protein n=1 Tax=Methanobacterium aggregans TaxID=1615586 RepID=UPI001AE81772|nr:chitobiase/beta-hexosaminidase C-terminal domain-containing protein [Methanobacterium aggregans]MBP2046998.1 putative repeat protein (TIGR01451 family) [Methanobacterium aggregans]